MKLGIINMFAVVAWLIIAGWRLSLWEGDNLGHGWFWLFLIMNGWVSISLILRLAK